MILLKKFHRLIALIFAVVLLAFTAGCGTKPSESTREPEPHESISSESSESTKPLQPSDDSLDPTETSSEAAKATYTMADIRKLKNTGHFAKKTLEHIFDGTINGKGKATGYHYTMVSDSKGRIIDGTRSDTDESGVFTGKVEVSGVKKNGFSSFFPESWSPQQVVDAINIAYDDAIANENHRDALWIGWYGELEIDMYLDSDKRITSAFPIYEGD